VIPCDREAFSPASGEFFGEIRWRTTAVAVGVTVAAAGSRRAILWGAWANSPQRAQWSKYRGGLIFHIGALVIDAAHRPIGFNNFKPARTIKRLRGAVAGHIVPLKTRV